MSGAIALRPAKGTHQEVRSIGASFVAIKTATVRNEYGKDETVKAGVTHVHDARHFLVTEYPHLFARDGQTRPRAKPAPRRRPATRAASAAPARKPLELPRPPLIRVSESRPTVKVELRGDVYRTMGDHAYGPGSDMETGGGLFGYAYSPKTNTIVVREAFGPGPASRARRGVVWPRRPAHHRPRRAVQARRLEQSRGRAMALARPP